MTIELLQFIYKALIASTFILVGYGLYTMYRDERSLSQWHKENN